MARHRYIITFATALVVAAGAIVVSHGILETPNARARIETLPVVVSLQDISEGHAIERTGVTVVQWPRGTVPAAAYVSLDSVVGRVTRVRIFKGEAIMPGRLMPATTMPIRD